jgi:hypothetical protein
MIASAFAPAMNAPSARTDRMVAAMVQTGRMGGSFVERVSEG